MATRTYPSFIVYKDNLGFFRWSYSAINGLIIAVSSESYVAKADCVRGVEIMQASFASPVFDSTKAFA